MYYGDTLGPTLRSDLQGLAKASRKRSHKERRACPDDAAGLLHSREPSAGSYGTAAAAL